jgi:hypothetical protein
MILCRIDGNTIIKDDCEISVTYMFKVFTYIGALNSPASF